jgi:GTP-binding protein
VLVNKIDRPDAEPMRVHDEVLELLMDLDASHEQFSCPFLYTSSRAGTATLELKEPGTTLEPLFETILKTIPPPKAAGAGPFQMLISTLDYSSYLGRIGIGRIERGQVNVGDTVALLPIGEPGPVGDGKFEQAKIVKLFAFEGLERAELETASAGEIVAVAGLAGVEIGKTGHGARSSRPPGGHRRRGTDDLGRLPGEQLAARGARGEVRDGPAAARAVVP